MRRRRWGCRGHKRSRRSSREEAVNDQSIEIRMLKMCSRS